MNNRAFMNTRRQLLLAAALGLTAGTALAQPAFPSRAITLIVPFAPGGIADITARTVAEAMTGSLGQPVVVDNRPSAGSIVASQAVASAKPDGHTLLLMSNSNAVSAAGLFKKLPYDTLKDLVPISTLGFFDLGVFVAANSRFASLPALIQYAKTHPGELKVGTIAVGSTQHLAAELFQTVTGTDLLAVPYKGSPAVLMALRGGDVDLALEIVGPMLPHVASNTVKALAVSSDHRNAALPEVQTVQQAGHAAYNVSSWNAIAAPSGTPAAVIERINKAIREAIASAPVRAKLEKQGMRLKSGSPEEAKALLESEIKRWGEVIKKAKIEAE